tara:strand:+ start:494 stop:835 length:342 start_codon:yes stop_codon:yes gene_type:complete
MGFKSKATKVNKAKKEARTEPIPRQLTGSDWQGMRTDPDAMNAISGRQTGLNRIRQTRDSTMEVRPHTYSRGEIENYLHGQTPTGDDQTGFSGTRGGVRGGGVGVRGGIPGPT